MKNFIFLKQLFCGYIVGSNLWHRFMRITNWTQYGGKFMTEMTDAFRNFDELAYLKSNHDVSEAVQKKRFSSGWQHYILYGFRENRLGVPPEVHHRVAEKIFESNCFIKPISELIPPKDGFIKPSLESIPPKYLRKRVHGDEDILSFERIGKQVSSDIYSIAKTTIKLDEYSRILDFGCGCGRVIQHFQELYKNASFYGVDIDKEAILWCQNHLSKIGEFSANEQSPPLLFKDDFFDFIYSISVFTHLPEDMQLLWLEELRRVTKSGGYLFLTVHGEELLNATEESKKHLQKAGFFYSVGSGTAGLPDFYQTSFHTEEYIHRCWSKFFEIEKIIKKGIANHQDLIVCRKPV